MKKFIKMRVNSLKLSNREKELTSQLSFKDTLTKKEILKTGIKMPKSTLHETLNSLLNKKVLLELEPEIYRVDQKVK